MSAHVVVEADGGSRGNPGPAGFGAVVRDGSSGEVLAERSGGLGETTNNVAEYEGLIAGLAAAIELGASEVDVRLDSKLVVEQMSGNWRVKHAKLQPLALKAGKLVRSLERVRFEWIPRDRNKHADRLANEAMDSQTGTAGTETATEDGAAPTSGSRKAGARTATTAVSEPAQTEPAQTEPARAGAAVTESAAAGHSRSWTGATGQPTRLLILRHGQTPMSVDRRYSGRGDVELTDTGRQQALSAAKRLAAMEGVVTPEGPAPVVASPLARTRRTAQAVVDATGGDLVFHEGLLETDFGAWEGLTFPEAAERYAELHGRWLGDPTVEPPQGESLQTVFERVRSAHQQLLRRYAGRTVILVSHVTPIKALLRIALDAGPSLFYRLHLDLASLSVAEFYPDGNASVRLVNDTSHLD